MEENQQIQLNNVTKNVIVMIHVFISIITIQMLLEIMGYANVLVLIVGKILKLEQGLTDIRGHQPRPVLVQLVILTPICLILNMIMVNVITLQITY